MTAGRARSPSTASASRRPPAPSSTSATRRCTRAAAAEEEGTTVLVVGGRPDEPFSVSPWERSAEALRFWRTEEWDTAIDVLSGQLIEHPDSAGTLYNLACAEARAGRARGRCCTWPRPSRSSARFGENAATDTDFDAIRDDPRFSYYEAVA